MASPVPFHRLFRRASTFGLLLFVLAAGCDGGQSDPADDSVSPSDSVPSVSSVPGTVYDLAYGFAPGDSFRYGVRLSQHIVLTTEGESSAVLGGEIPGSADVTVEADGVFEYTVGEGPRAGTFEVVITGEFDDVVVDGEADGQPVDGVGDIAQLGTFDPFTRTVVVDRQGRLVGDQGAGGGFFTPGGSTFAGLSGDVGQLPGPILSEGAVGVGDTWSATFESASLGDDPVKVEVEAELVGVDGRETGDILTITDESTTGEARTDLAELFKRIFAATEIGAGSGESEDENLDGIVFQVVNAPSTSTTTSDFGSGLGLATVATTTGRTSLTMDVALPGSEADALEEFSMNLQTDQTVRYTLLE